MELGNVRDLVDVQSGVVSRRQLVEAGATDVDIRRWVRRRDLVRVHSGIYVNHTGPLSWSSRAWVAVLFHWPAALSHESAVNLAGDPVHVAVDATRKAVTRLPGVRVHRLAGLQDRVLWNMGPPRVRFEDALLGLVSAAPTRADAMALVADACRRRRTTPLRVAHELEMRTRVRNRAWMSDVLAEAAAGVQSLLESGYRRRVERAHALPRGEGQRRQVTVDGVVYRDVSYRRLRAVVELDGRLGHEDSRDRWNDMDRDLLAATEELLTVRLGWRHVEVTPCRTAARLAVVFRARGWRGSPRRCGPGCGIDGSLSAVS